MRSALQIEVLFIECDKAFQEKIWSEEMLSMTLFQIQDCGLYYTSAFIYKKHHQNNCHLHACFKDTIMSMKEIYKLFQFCN